MDWFVSHYISDPDITSHPRLSPLHAEIGPHCCPAVIVSTDLDPLVADGVTYAHSLVQAGVDVQFRTYTGSPTGSSPPGANIPWLMKCWTTLACLSSG
ncbi:alpha/beta hydrolase fold domain-containing protein [Auritidibacter sp. NML120636]|uniref:alpha/beta hydrolase fold domain-containing protein n=1 Tax=Auritidibacter TaxID=1160973 RepID=UPI000D733E39|nr:hypothetical protein DCC25_04540 [Auritidibacter sp. NML120636]